VATGRKATIHRSTCPTDQTGERTFSASRVALSRTTLPTSRHRLKELANELGVFFHDVKGAIFHRISKWDYPAHPDVSLL
jgi:hypothetical protein